MKKILISVFLSTSLFAQQIFLECENLTPGSSNTKWLDGKCVRTTPKLYTYYLIDKSKGTWEEYGWKSQLKVGGYWGTNSSGEQRLCGGTYLLGQEFIDYQIKEISRSIDAIWRSDIYNYYNGIAEFHTEKIQLFVYDEGSSTKGTRSKGRINRINGKKIGWGGFTTHQCEPINSKKFNSVVAKMKADSSKLQKAQNKFIEESKKF
tara:strand:+ start:92 stop:709 length:618 start_codon:yes stop_codon:yes gene_type:complete